MQQRFLAAAEFEVFGGGSKGPGKSDLLLMGAVRQVEKPRYKALITRETGPQMRELIDRSHRYYPKLPQKPYWNGSDRRWTFPSEDGSTYVQFEAIATQEDVERIQGQEWAHVAQDEIGNVPDERVVDLVQAEIRCPNPDVIRMWRGSGNPGKPGHAWIKRRFVNKCGRDGRTVFVRKLWLPGAKEPTYLTRRFIPGTVLDNPVYANDPLYMAQLWTLPETLRRQLLFGDWDAGYGQALDELDEAVHFVKPFIPPDGWPLIAAFDWGYAHNWVLVYGAVQEDGQVFICDTVRGRRHRPKDIADRIKSRVPLDRIRGPVYSDWVAFQSTKARAENTPTIAEQMLEHGVLLSQGNSDRKAGLNNLRHYIAWKNLLPSGLDADPAMRFMDTPGNHWLFEQLQTMMIDEDDMEDVLKIDADPETGQGGDDGYDALRMLMASRPPRAIGTFFKEPVSAFSPQTLAHMKEKLYRDGPVPVTRRRSGIYSI